MHLATLSGDHDRARVHNVRLVIIDAKSRSSGAERLREISKPRKHRKRYFDAKDDYLASPFSKQSAIIVHCITVHLLPTFNFAIYSSKHKRVFIVPNHATYTVSLKKDGC